MANRPKVFITRSDLPEVGIKILRERCDIEIYDSSEKCISTDELIKKMVGKDALFIISKDVINKEVIDVAVKNGLKVIATMSVGVDHIDIKAVKRTSLRIGHTSILCEATAELTVGLLLATSRRIVEGNKSIVRGEWIPWGSQFMCGRGLNKSTVGILGFGQIGQSVARKLIPFGVSKILYTGPREKNEGDKLGAEFVSFDSLLHQSDFIIVTCPLTSETRGIFTAEKFSLMKRSAIFINTGRGGIVDQEALLQALENKLIAAAGLDVMTPEPLPKDHPLVKLDNCVLTPHIGNACIEARDEMSIITAKNILAALEGEKMPCEYIV